MDEETGTIPNILVDLQITVDGRMLGEITLELFSEAAPTLVANFILLVKNKSLDGTSFFKLKPNYYIQGGDIQFNSGVGGVAGFGPRIYESHLDGELTDKHSVVMVNKGPHSTCSQFLITLTPTPWLKGWMAVFGRVSKGFQILTQLQALDTDDQGTILNEVKIEKATLIN